MTLPGILASGGLMPGAPTIGTATDGGNGTSANVAFTAPSWVGKGTGTVTYTATSSPGGITGTSTSSPITVSGLTTGTAYTFTVRATTSYGVSGPSSASSNSVTPVVPGAYDSIATATPSGTSSVEFSNIPQTFSHLQIRAISRVSWANAGLASVNFRFNNNSGSTAYNYADIVTNGNSVALTADYGDNNQGLFMWAYGDAADTGIFGVAIFDVLDYASTNKFKTTRCQFGGANNLNNSNNDLRFRGHVLKNTDAIQSIQITAGTGSFVSGTSFALYGIRGS